MILSPLLAVTVFGLGASVAFGSGDYCGGLAGKVNPPERVVAVSHAVTLVAFVLLALLRGEALPGGVNLAWSLGAGLASAVGLLCLYRGLSLGPMGVVAAVSAVLSAAVPVVVASTLGQAVGLPQAAGFALALAGVVLLSVTGRGRGSGLPWAVGA
ncbi:MAG TPA: EamA family transporter, partial [Deinococcales bacterium]|nr:EamA family transporter [Deinococcales bacterium]